LALVRHARHSRAGREQAGGQIERGEDRAIAVARARDPPEAGREISARLDRDVEPGRAEVALLLGDIRVGVPPAHAIRRQQRGLDRWSRVVVLRTAAPGRQRGDPGDHERPSAHPCNLPSPL
jgi:hypothetical protein